MIPAFRTSLLAALRSARRLRRATSLLACVAVLGWTLLAATHTHDHESDAGQRGDHTHCVLCVAMPSGATPPQQAFTHVAPAPAGTITTTVAIPAPAAAPSFSYLSRGPPAA